MLAHDAEAFFQRSLVVTGCHSFVQVIDQGEVGIMKCLALLHDTDTPVEIGRKAVMQVVVYQSVTAGKKGLMTNQHPFAETFPC